MTARHHPDPAPSQRSQRHDRQDRRAMYRALVHIVEHSPEARASLVRFADAVLMISPWVRRLQWANPQPMRTGTVTWDARRRRHRRQP